jgi:hypothetical protein
MAYDFLGLVNDVNRKLNEVELTAANFATATGFYSAAKDAVNSSIRYINQYQFEWPFNHVEQTDTLVAGDVRYPFPSDMKTPDMDSFRIKRDATLNNQTVKLKTLSYEDYLNRYVDFEYNTTNTGIRDVPQMAFRTPNLEYGVVPPPDEAYEVVYEYYRLPVDLLNATDVPSIPEQFRSVIIDGAMYHAYIFRGNSQDATIQQNRFEDSIKAMRSLYINRYEYLRDTRVDNPVGISQTLRVN